MRLMSMERFGEMIESEVYMRSIMEALGVATPKRALEKVKEVAHALPVLPQTPPEITTGNLL